MAVAPYSPWRLRADGDEPPPPGPYTGTVLGMYAPLYAAAGQVGITPRELDACEPWQVAEMLGMSVDADNVNVDVPASAGLATRRGDEPAPVAPPRPAGRDVLAERVRHARGEGPAPEAEQAKMGTVMATIARVENEQ